MAFVGFNQENERRAGCLKVMGEKNEKISLLKLTNGKNARYNLSIMLADRD